MSPKNTILLNTKKMYCINFRYFSSLKSIDYSKVPKLDAKDIEERHVGGSASTTAAKTFNCVVLKHIPSGIVVKCQDTRFLEQNRKRALETLTVKVDNWANGEDSVEAQKKKFLEKKLSKTNQKKEKLRQLKENWKERENIS